jgi:hypothetical protein
VNRENVVILRGWENPRVGVDARNT